MTPEQREKLMSDTSGSIPQDHLGDLKEKTVIELQELLSRQQKLLKNFKFLERLSDKGQKIRNMAARLESVIQSRKDVDATADLFEKMALEAAEARRVPPLYNDNEMNLLRMMANRSENKVYVDERSELGGSSQEKYVNSYDRVIRKAEMRPGKSLKFFPNKSIKHRDVSEFSIESLAKLKLGDNPTNELQIPTRESQLKGIVESEETETCKDAKVDSVTSQSVSSELSDGSGNNENPHKPNSSVESEKSPSSVDKMDAKLCTGLEKVAAKGKYKHSYDESLIAADRWHHPDHGPAKMITIEESITVLEKQRVSQEAFKAQQAAEKLAQRLHINMASFDPEGTRNLVYRNPANAESEDEDSDDVEEDAD